VTANVLLKCREVILARWKFQDHLRLTYQGRPMFVLINDFLVGSRSR